MSKFTLPCSCLICKELFTAQIIHRHYNSKHVDKPHRGDCLVCGSEISKNSSKYCSRSCSAKHTNMQKDRTKFKPGPSKGYVPSNYAPFTKVTQCPVCNKFHPGNNTCSKECKSTLLSNAMKRRISNGFNPNSNRGRGKQSYLERSFGEWIDKTFPPIEYIQEYPFKRKDVVKTYFVDFFFPSLNLVIELDGTQHKYAMEYDRERDAYISSTYGIRVVRITHAEYQSQSRINEISALLST